VEKLVTEPSSLAPEAATDWRAVLIVVASGVVSALQIGKGIIALPALRADISLSLEAAGWVISVFAFLGIAGGIPTGVAVNRFGDRLISLLGLIVLALGALISALATGFATLLMARIIEGTGFLLITVAAPALLQRIVAPRDRDLAFGIWSSYMLGGMAIALLCGAALEGWRPFWFINAALAAIAAGLVAFAVPQANILPGVGLPAMPGPPSWHRDRFLSLSSLPSTARSISRWRASCPFSSPNA
jgi:MFS family permease